MVDVTRQRLGGGDDPWGRLVASLHSHNDGCKSGVMVEYSRPKLRWVAEWFPSRRQACTYECVPGSVSACGITRDGS